MNGFFWCHCQPRTRVYGRGPSLCNDFLDFKTKDCQKMCCCCLRMVRFSRKQPGVSLELGSTGVQNKGPDTHIPQPLFESHVMVFESLFNDQGRPFTAADRVEMWLEDSFSCKDRGHEKEQPQLKACVGILSRQSRQSSPSCTQRQPDFRDWLWDHASNSDYSGFLSFD